MSQKPLINDKPQGKIFWPIVLLAIVLVTLDTIALYHIKPALNNTDPYNSGCKAGAVFLAVFFGTGIFASIVYYLTQKPEKYMVKESAYAVKHKKRHG